MTFFIMLALGLLQGLTEFLPVSSSGHLTLFNLIFPTEGNFLFLTIVLHLATMLAVLFCFRKKVWYLITHPFSKDTLLLVVASIPTFVIFLVLNPIIEKSFSGNFLPIGFCFSAVMLTTAHFWGKRKSKKEGITWCQALLMGTMQGIALFPGVSRSGTTLATGMMSGANQEEGANFSFLMSLPVITGSFLYEILFHFDEIALSAVDVFPLICSFLLAFLVGILSIRLMLGAVKKAKLWMFSIYLILLSLVTLFII